MSLSQVCVKCKVMTPHKIKDNKVTCTKCNKQYTYGMRVQSK